MRKEEGGTERRKKKDKERWGKAEKKYEACQDLIIIILNLASH